MEKVDQRLEVVVDEWCARDSHRSAAQTWSSMAVVINNRATTSATSQSHCGAVGRERLRQSCLLLSRALISQPVPRRGSSPYEIHSSTVPSWLWMTCSASRLI